MKRFINNYITLPILTLLYCFLSIINNIFSEGIKYAFSDIKDQFNLLIQVSKFKKLDLSEKNFWKWREENSKFRDEYDLSLIEMNRIYYYFIQGESLFIPFKDNKAKTNHFHDTHEEKE